MMNMGKFVFASTINIFAPTSGLDFPALLAVRILFLLVEHEIGAHSQLGSARYIIA
jgi:hypothetical protein